jgi:hypothetical protein
MPTTFHMNNIPLPSRRPLLLTNLIPRHRHFPSRLTLILRKFPQLLNPEIIQPYLFLFLLEDEDFSLLLEQAGLELGLDGGEFGGPGVLVYLALVLELGDLLLDLGDHLDGYELLV